MRDPLFLDPCYDQNFLCMGLCKVVPAPRMLPPKLDFAHTGIVGKDVEPSACRQWLRSTGCARESNLGKGSLLRRTSWCMDAWLWARNQIRKEF